MRSLDRSFLVVNDPVDPAPALVVRSARETLASAGGTLAFSPETCDLLIVCRERLQDGEPSTRSSYAYTRATSLDPAALTLTTPPSPEVWDMDQDDPDARRLATVEIVLDRWDSEAGSWRILREIMIRIGKQGVDGSEFSRAELLALWEVMEDWASYYAAQPST